MKCPYCGSKEKWRMHKPLWMKFTPGKMDNMRCFDCGHEYTRWLHIFSMKNNKAKAIIGFWHFIAFFILMTIIAFVITIFMN